VTPATKDGYLRAITWNGGRHSGTNAVPTLTCTAT
jgi:hypothetical protein